MGIAIENVVSVCLPVCAFRWMPYLFFRAANRAALTATVVLFPDSSDEKLRMRSDLIAFPLHSMQTEIAHTLWGGI